MGGILIAFVIGSLVVLILNGIDWWSEQKEK